MGARDIAADAQQSEFECSSRGSREELGAGGAAAAQAKVAKRGGGSEAHCGAASGASGAAIVWVLVYYIPVTVSKSYSSCYTW